MYWSDGGDSRLEVIGEIKVTAEWTNVLSDLYHFNSTFKILHFQFYTKKKKNVQMSIWWTIWRNQQLIKRQHGYVAAPQLQVLEMGHCLCEFFHVLSLCLGGFPILWFPWIGFSKNAPKCECVRACMCMIPCGGLASHPGWILTPCTQCYYSSLRIHLDPDYNKTVIEDKRMNELLIKFLLHKSVVQWSIARVRNIFLFCYCSGNQSTIIKGIILIIHLLYNRIIS